MGPNFHLSEMMQVFSTEAE